MSTREHANALIVVPCYNERDNVVPLVDEILATYARARVCIVEDSSPDGTTQVVRSALAERPAWSQRVHLIVRTKKDGRGGAIRDGLVWGAAQEPAFDAFVEMDCDFSHEPAAIERGLDLLAAGNDVVIGARYPSGTIVGWTYERRVFSFFANSLARALIDHHISDYTNGFRFYSQRAARLLVGIEQHHKGYIYLSESLSHLLRAGMRVDSFPIFFRNRERGESNTSLAEISSALKGIFQIAWQHRFGGP